MHRIVLLSLFVMLFSSGLIAQSENGETVRELNDTVQLQNDTIRAQTDTIQPIDFTPDTASEYLLQMLEKKNFWRPEGDTIRLSLSRLVDHFKEPYDSVRTRLLRFEYDSIVLEPASLVSRERVSIRWLNDSTFINNSVPPEREPFDTIINIVVKPIDTTAINFRHGIPGLQLLVDSAMVIRDTIIQVNIDSLYLESLNIPLHRVENNRIVPPFVRPAPNRTTTFNTDSTQVVITETDQVIMGAEGSPFYIVSSEQMNDSLKYAVHTLLSYNYARDSLLLFVSDVNGSQTPFWLSGKRDEMRRLWIKNMENDSITIWMGNPARNEITLVLEENVSVERRQKLSADNIPITTQRPSMELATLKPLDEIPVFWRYGLSSSLTLNQTYLSNWARGGQSSFAPNVDIRSTADYTNQQRKIRWNSEGRLRYGSIWTEEHGFRTNTDNLEFNSQFNTDLREKLDFSSTFYFKTQVAKGYNYPNDSVVVSRFLNPGAMTIGVGVEYTPIKDTRINFAPLSYRNTFVLDTAAINQTAHGIDADQRSRQEMGGQLVIRNRTNITDGLRVTNAIRLFSSYLEKPQNVDLDWEMNIEKRISWYFLVRVNLHVIYDDDIRFPVLDSAGDPVLLPDGTPRKGPRTQFKQFLGLTLAFTI